jgi:mono/diheme cytochrome c family protein
MGKFIAGLIIGAVLLAAAGSIYLHYGFINLAADQEANPVEAFVMGPAMDRYAERHAPKVKNPLKVDDATLIAGIKLYKADCAICHGGPANPVSDVGRALYPQAPQFSKDAPDMPEEQNYWIIKHGIQRTGMPAWEKILTDSEVWQLTAFLRKFEDLEKLSPAVQEEWKKPGEVLTPAARTPPPGAPRTTSPKEAPTREHRHQH